VASFKFKYGILPSRLLAKNGVQNSKQFKIDQSAKEIHVRVYLLNLTDLLEAGWKLEVLLK
jgi:hypothetical protein